MESLFDCIALMYSHKQSSLQQGLCQPGVKGAPRFAGKAFVKTCGS